LRSLQHLGALPKLLSLFVSSNRLSDAAEIDRLSLITSLTELNMVNTPLSRKPNYRTIVIYRCPSLKFLDSREVTYEEKDRVAAMFQSQEAYRPPALQMNAMFLNASGTAQQSQQQQQQQQQQQALVPQQLLLPQSKAALSRGTLSLEVVSSAALPAGASGNAAPDRFSSPIFCVGLTKPSDEQHAQPNASLMLPIAKQVLPTLAWARCCRWAPLSLTPCVDHSPRCEQRALRAAEFGCEQRAAAAAVSDADACRAAAAARQHQHGQR
jgi:hypothetical protein